MLAFGFWPKILGVPRAVPRDSQVVPYCTTNAGRVMEMPRGGGDSETISYVKELFELFVFTGDWM